MAQEFTIKSEDIENKINQLLPSQGGFQAGVDFSASTMVIPIVDLTETAEGSSLREDLQKAFSLTSTTAFQVNNATTTLVNTTGTFRVFGTAFIGAHSSAASCTFSITDGTTTKVLYTAKGISTSQVQASTESYDFLVKLEAGDSLVGATTSTIFELNGVTRQIADLAGNLVNP